MFGGVFRKLYQKGALSPEQIAALRAKGYGLAGPIASAPPAPAQPGFLATVARLREPAPLPETQMPGRQPAGIPGGYFGDVGDADPMAIRRRRKLFGGSMTAPMRVE